LLPRKGLVSARGSNSSRTRWLAVGFSKAIAKSSIDPKSVSPE
jgi:hypothetical protein